MKQKFLFWVALATMLVTGALCTDVQAALKVLGNTIPLKDGTSTIGSITIEQSVEDRTLQIQFEETSSKTLDVASDVNLISYTGDDYDYILIGFDDDLEITHSTKDGARLFEFWDTKSDPVEVFFMNNNPKKDVTLKINITDEETWKPVFYLYRMNLYLNPFGTGLVEDSKLRKLNFDIQTASDMIFLDNQHERAFVNLGYGDYHFSFTNTEKKGDVFFNNVDVKGLGRLDSYDARNYISKPQGLGFYLEGTQAALYECGAAIDFIKRYQGEVNLTYAPFDWQYFGPGDYSSWRLQESCEGGVILQATCSGDLSSLESEDLPWMPFKDIITRVELQEDVMYPCDKLPKGAFKDFTALTSASLSGLYRLTEIPDKLFFNCGKLTEVTFPDITEGIESVGDHAFWMCEKLTTMELPETIEEIGDYAFYFCRQLDVTLPKSLKKVGYRAFDQCNTVTMPKEIGENVETVKENEEGQWASVFRIVRLVFPGTMQEWLARDNSWIMGAWKNYTSDGGYLNIDGKDIVDLVIPNGTTELKPYAFANATQIKTVTFPSTLTKIGDRAFYECKKLEAANLPDNITKLGDECFAYSGIETLTLPKGLTVIPKEAFSYCENLESLNLPEGLLGIGVEAFQGCEALQTLVLPNSVTAIAPGAFAGSGLKEVTLPKSLNYIEISAFGSCMFLTTVNIPAGMGDVEFGMSSLNGLTIDELSDEQKMILGFALVTDIRFGGDMNEWLAKSRPWLMENLSATIPDFINEIYVPHEVNLYLSGSDKPVKELVIPEGVTAIPENAFHMTTLATLSLPKSLKDVKDDAFAGCKALIAAECKATLPPTLGKNAFSDIHENATLRVYASAVDAYKDSDWSKYFAIEGAFSEYKVTAAASDDALGEVTLSFDKKDIISEEGKNSFVVGNNAKAHLVATPKGKARFVSWTDEGENYGLAERDVVINGDIDFVAKFEKDSFNIAVTVKGIDPSLVEITGAGRYGEGDNATLSFELKDKDHYTFYMWLFDENNFRTTQTLSFENIDANHDVEIVFNVNKYTVSATVVPAGAGVVKGQGEYDYGTDYTLTLEPAEGYELKEWRDGTALDETTNTLSGMVYGNINIECVLQLKHYTISAAVNDEKMGSVSGAGSYEHGSTVTLTAKANNGYQFTGWSNGSTDNPLVFTAKEDVSVTANFELIPIKEYTLTVYVAPEGSGTVEGAGKYEEGKTATLVALPAEGYEFLQWSDGNTDNPRTITVTENLTLIASFKKKTVEPDEFTVTVVVNPAEGGQVIGAGTYKKGATATLVAIAAEGYEFKNWSDGSTDNPHAIVVEKDLTLIANFDKVTIKPDEFTISVYVTPNGSGTVEGAGTYEQGQTATLVALPAEGYEFREWSDGNTENPREIVVEKNLTLICNFHKIGDGVEQIEQGIKSQEAGPRKVLRQGHIVIILPDGSEYDAQGRQIK